MAEPDYKKDMGAFLSMANYPLVKYTDMTTETRDSAVDICVTAVEKFPTDLEKCTQVRGRDKQLSGCACPAPLASAQ